MRECIVKMGAQGCWISNDNESTHLAAEDVKAVDATAAGDSFNAGYLASRINKLNCNEAVKRGQALASKVIQYKGAIIDGCSEQSNLPFAGRRSADIGE